MYVGRYECVNMGMQAPLRLYVCVQACVKPPCICVCMHECVSGYVCVHVYVYMTIRDISYF